MNENMEKLSMCRICVADNIPLRSIVNTRLHDMYECLTKMPFVTSSRRPILACEVCCLSLENSYELRRRCLQSEEMFTQLLRNNVQVNQPIMADRHLSLRDVVQTIPIEYDNVEVKQEAPEESRDDNSPSPDSEDVTATCSFLKVEIETDNEMSDDAAVEQDDYHNPSGLHTECEIPADIVKDESLVDADAREASSSEDNTETNNITQTEADDVLSSAPVPVRHGQGMQKKITREKIGESRKLTDIKLSEYTGSSSTSRHDSAPTEISEHNMIDQDGGEEKPYQCNVCNKSFARHYHLRRHVLIHSDEKPYQCNVCKKCFKRQSHLDVHFRTHTGEKPYQCTLCKRCFNVKSHLVVHVRTHTGEKPYQCNDCEKCFSRKGDLDVHIRTHTGAKPHQCSVCNRCFNAKSHLDVHIRTHTGEKPYECKVCKKCFNVKSHLDDHSRIHTGEKPHQCLRCDKCFNRKGQLHMHMLRIHTGSRS